MHISGYTFRIEPALRGKILRSNFKVISRVIKGYMAGLIMEHVVEKSTIPNIPGLFRSIENIKSHMKVSRSENNLNKFKFELRPFDIVKSLVPFRLGDWPHIQEIFINMSQGKAGFSRKAGKLQIKFQRNQTMVNYFKSFKLPLEEKTKIQQDAYIQQLKAELNSLTRSPEYGLKKIREAIDILHGILSDIKSRPDLISLKIIGGLESLNGLEKKLKSIKGRNLTNQELAEVLTGMGMAYNYALQFEKALSVLKQAIKLQPQEVNGYINLGYAYEKMNELYQALKWYEEALKRSPHDFLVQTRIKRVTQALAESAKNN